MKVIITDANYIIYKSTCFGLTDTRIKAIQFKKSQTARLEKTRIGYFPLSGNKFMLIVLYNRRTFHKSSIYYPYAPVKPTSSCV